jgi:hypothetical protein
MKLPTILEQIPKTKVTNELARLIKQTENICAVLSAACLT